MFGRYSTAEMRSLSFAIAYFSLAYYFSLVWLSTYLPRDSWYISICTTGYACYGTILSVLGVVGIVKRCPDLIAIFSHHLFSETFLSTVPKIGIIYLFYDVTKNACDTSGLNNPRVNTPAWNQADGCLARGAHCSTVLTLAHAILVMSLISLTYGQWSVATICRSYSLELESEQFGGVQKERQMEEGLCEDEQPDDGDYERDEKQRL